MLDKDVKYYKSWSVGGWIYRLSFIPGKDTEITTEYIELPATFILNDVSVRSGYDNDIPIGLPLADEMDLTWDLANMYDDSYATWSEFRQWLIDGSTIKGSTYFNTVILQSNNGSGETFTKVEFIGVQDVKPQKEIEVTQSSMTFKCSYVSLNRVIFERLKWSEILPDKTSFDYKCSGFSNYQNWKYPAVIEYQYNFKAYFKNGQGHQLSYYTMVGPIKEPHELYKTHTFTTGWKGQENTEIHFHKLDTILNIIYYAAQDNLRKFTRRSDNFVLYSHTPLDHLIINSAANDEYINSKAHILPSDVYLFTGVYDKDEIIRKGGYFSDNDKNVSIYKYKTPWDWIKALGQLGMKITFSYSTGLNCQIEYTKIMVNPNTFSAGITKQNSVLPLKIGEGANLKQTAQITLIGKTGGYDVENYTTNDGGAENDNSYSEELCLHNNAINYNYDDNGDELWRAPALSILKIFPTFTDFYYLETENTTISGGKFTAMKKMSDIASIDFGESMVYSNTLPVSVPAQPPFYYRNDKYEGDLQVDEAMSNKILSNASGSWYEHYGNMPKSFQEYLDYRQERTGLGVLLANAYFGLLGKTRQSLIEVTTNSDVALPRYNGYIYTVDVSALLPINIDIGIENTKAILVSVETNFIKNESSCKFFIPEL